MAPQTPASVNGTSIRAALQIADPNNDAWGTENLLGARDGHFIISDDLDVDRDLHVDNSLGRSSASGADVGNEVVAGSIVEFARHVTSEKLIAMLMGAADVNFQGPISDSGTADGGTTTTLADSTKAWDVDAYAGQYVVTGHAGTGGEQIRQIVSNTTTALTVSPAWTAPAATFPTYEISKFAPQTKSTATGGGAATLTDTVPAWTADALIGKWIRLTGGTGSGQAQRIIDNTTDTITVAQNWTTAPIAGTTYEVMNQAAEKTYTWATDMRGIFATYGKNKSDVFTEIFPSVKVTNVGLAGPYGSPLELTTQVIASGRTHSSTINTTSTFNNVTDVETENRILLDGNAVVLINNQEDGVLVPAESITVPQDQIYPTNLFPFFLIVPQSFRKYP